MNENKIYKIYTQEDIQRYLNGQMSAVDMYALEKQAIEDPFLADAIDGYQTISNETAKFDLEWLNQKLHAQNAKVVQLATPQKRFPWKKMAIAASFLGIITLAGVLYFNKKDKTPTIVANNNPVKSETDVPNNVIVPQKVAKKDSNQTTLAQSNAVSKLKNNTANKPIVYVKPDEITDYYIYKDANPEMEDLKSTAYVVKPLDDDKKSEKEKVEDFKILNDSLKRSSNVVAATPSSPNTPTVNDFGKQEQIVVTGIGNNNNERKLENKELIFDKRVANQNAPSPNRNSLPVASQKEENNTNLQRFANTQRNYVFNYRVVDEHGNQIPFTNVSVPADQLVTYSRVDGTFGLFSSDSTLNVNLKAAGFVPQNLQLSYAPSGYSKITLKSLPATDDAIVVSSPKKDIVKKSAKLNVEIIEAEPADGLSNYDSYIANNINNNQKPNGEVVLSFEINKAGEPTNIIIDKSLSSDADQEAIRLLKQGPKWKAKKRKQAKGKITIKF